MADFLKVSTGHFEVTDRMRELMDEVLSSGIISYGDKSREYESEFAWVHECDYGILSNSGTSALQVALQAIKEIEYFEDFDEVIVPTTTFVATSNIVLHNKMKPVFVDIELDTYGMDPNKIEEKITADTRAIVPVHLFGQSCNMSEIKAIADKYELKVIEDSCETMFMKHNNATVGSMGDIGCFSMYVAHILVAGVGGISITNNYSYAEKMRSLVNHGLTAENLNLDENAQVAPMRGRKFIFDSIGHSFRITEFEAAIALAQLEMQHELIAQRQKLGRLYTAGINEINEKFGEQILIPAKEVNEHVYMMYPILINKDGDDLRDKKTITDFLNNKGIETRDMPSLMYQPAKQYRHLVGDLYPNSDWVARSGFYVGSHPYLTEDHVAHVLENLALSLHEIML